MQSYLHVRVQYEEKEYAAYFLQFAILSMITVDSKPASEDCRASIESNLKSELISEQVQAQNDTGSEEVQTEKDTGSDENPGIRQRITGQSSQNLSSFHQSSPCNHLNIVQKSF